MRLGSPHFPTIPMCLLFLSHLAGLVIVQGGVPEWCTNDGKSANCCRSSAFQIRKGFQRNRSSWSQTEEKTCDKVYCWFRPNHALLKPASRRARGGAPGSALFFFWGEGGDGEFGVGEEDRGGGPGVGSERMGGAGCGSGAIVFERSGWVNLHCCCWIPFFIS